MAAFYKQTLRVGPEPLAIVTPGDVDYVGINNRGSGRIRIITDLSNANSAYGWIYAGEQDGIFVPYQPSSVQLSSRFRRGETIAWLQSADDTIQEVCITWVR